jgi:hypothetical protein
VIIYQASYYSTRFKAYVLNLVLLFCGLNTALSQTTNEAIFKGIMSQPLPSKTAERALFIAQQWLEKPYTAHSLESNPESLVINLHEFDCATLVENALAIALTRDQSFASFKQQLQALRYRHGKINGYASRLHYFTDWLTENERKKVLMNITQQAGGKLYKKAPYFMSAHQQKYPQMEDYRTSEAIRMAEVNLQRQTFYYIPKAEVAAKEVAIQDGDIIAITTSIAGLDVSHEGLAIRKNGRVHLLHASLDAKKVIISEEPLADYLSKHKTQTGIMVSRIQ